MAFYIELKQANNPQKEIHPFKWTGAFTSFFKAYQHWIEYRQTFKDLFEKHGFMIVERTSNQEPRIVKILEEPIYNPKMCQNYPTKYGKVWQNLAL